MDDQQEITQAVGKTLRPVRAKVLFNPLAGVVDASSYHLTEILLMLQAWQIIPEIHMVTPESRLAAVVRGALQRGIQLVIVCGGDGTIESAVSAMMHTNATLGIIPTGTRNNVARSLGIPADLPSAVELLRTGKRISIDIGRAQCGRTGRWFLETSSIGLVPALYPAAEDIQRGNLARVAEFLSTLVSSQPARLDLVVNGEKHYFSSAHLALVSNMPYFGANLQVSPSISYTDQMLDVFVFSDLTKLELVSYALQTIGGTASDARIVHYRASSVHLRSTPKMPVMADSIPLGEGNLTVSLRHAGLRVIAGMTLADGSPSGGAG